MAVLMRSVAMVGLHSEQLDGPFGEAMSYLQRQREINNNLNVFGIYVYSRLIEMLELASSWSDALPANEETATTICRVVQGVVDNMLQETPNVQFQLLREFTMAKRIEKAIRNNFQ